MKTYLITGGAGFFGSILKKELLADGAFCVSIDIEPDDFTHENFVAYKDDIRDKEALRKIFSKYKFDAVFHCAALLAHDVKSELDLWTSNVDGTRNVADFAREFGVQKLLFISSNCLWGRSFEVKVTEEEKPEPIELYGKTKWECEKILLEHADAVNSVIFRSPTIIDEGRLGLLSLLFEFIDENRNIPMVSD